MGPDETWTNCFEPPGGNRNAGFSARGMSLIDVRWGLLVLFLLFRVVTLGKDANSKELFLLSSTRSKSLSIMASSTKSSPPRSPLTIGKTETPLIGSILTAIVGLIATPGSERIAGWYVVPVVMVGRVATTCPFFASGCMKVSSLFISSSRWNVCDVGGGEALRRRFPCCALWDAAEENFRRWVGPSSLFRLRCALCRSSLLWHVFFKPSNSSIGWKRPHCWQNLTVIPSISSSANAAWNTQMW